MSYELERRAVLRRVSAKQMGLFTTDQATIAELSLDQLATDVKYGLLERKYPSVFALTGMQWSQPRVHLAATLAAGLGALTTHRAGAWLFGLTRHDQKPEVSVPPHRFLKVKGVRLHRIQDLPEQPVFRQGVPTTDVNRVLIDVGGVLPLMRTRDALDRGIAGKLLTPMSVRAELERLAKRGRRGIAPMRRLLDEAGVTGSHPPSVLEAKMRRLIDRAGLPQPECQFTAGMNGEYRLDFIWPEVMLVIEVDGWEYHSSFDAFHQGLNRQNALTLQGYAFLSYSWLHVTREQPRVISELRDGYRSRRPISR